MRRHAHAAAALVLAGALGGCLDANVTPPPPTPTREPDPTPAISTYQVDGAVWYEGLVIRFDVVTATLDARGGPVEVHLRIDNPNDDVGALDGAITLVAGGKTWEATRESTIPEIPVQGTGGTTLTYELQGVDSIEDAYLAVGAAPLHVVQFPITAAAGVGGAVTGQPEALVLKGNGTAGTTKITLRSGQLRWDLPDWSQELDATLQALTVTYDVTYVGDFSGGQAFTGENVALRLPDGTVVESRADGHSQSVELIGPGKTKKNLFSRFEVPAGTTGAFALLVRSGTAVRAIPFTIGG
jgi:hypothetical protein